MLKIHGTYSSSATAWRGFTSLKVNVGGIEVAVVYNKARSPQ
jgi:hypothetical protein